VRYGNPDRARNIAHNQLHGSGAIRQRRSKTIDATTTGSGKLNNGPPGLIVTVCLSPEISVMFAQA
jgi:hypothetical protein